MFVITFMSRSFTRVFLLLEHHLYTLSGNPPDKYDKIIALIFSQWSQSLTLFFVICGGFNSRKFSYLKEFLLFLVHITKIVVATFHQHYLGHRIKYTEVGSITQQFLPTTRPCCSIELIELFLLWFILVTYNIGIYICIHVYKVSYIHSLLLSSTVTFFLHCMLNILKNIFSKKCFVKLMIRLLHSTIHQVMCYFWVFILNPFSGGYSSEENCVSFGLLVSDLSLSQSV